MDLREFEGTGPIVYAYEKQSLLSPDENVYEQLMRKLHDLEGKVDLLLKSHQSFLEKINELA